MPIIHSNIRPALNASGIRPLQSSGQAYQQQQQQQQPPTTATPSAQHPFSDDADEKIARLKHFLHYAPHMMTAANHGDIRKYPLDNGEFISCVYWNRNFLISGTDIVRIIQYRFRCKGIAVSRPKKLEEGVFSDLRNLRAGQEAILEEPRSDLLKYLYDNDAIRTQKKQKVFYWYRVPHDNLYNDAVEREMRRLTTIDNIGALFQHLTQQQQATTNNMMMPGGLSQQQQQQQQHLPQQPQTHQHQMAIMAPEPVKAPRSTPTAFLLDDKDPLLVSFAKLDASINNSGGSQGALPVDPLLMFSQHSQMIPSHLSGVIQSNASAAVLHAIYPQHQQPPHQQPHHPNGSSNLLVPSAGSEFAMDEDTLLLENFLSLDSNNNFVKYADLQTPSSNSSSTRDSNGTSMFM